MAGVKGKSGDPTALDLERLDRQRLEPHPRKTGDARMRGNPVFGAGARMVGLDWRALKTHQCAARFRDPESQNHADRRVLSGGRVPFQMRPYRAGGAGKSPAPARW